MIEKREAEIDTESEDLQIQVMDDPVEETAAQTAPDDELENYTKSVSKRINKLNAKTRQAEERAQQMERLAMQKEQELQQYRQITQQQEVTVLQKEEEALVSKQAQVDDIYRKAVEAGDPDLMSKADTLKNDIAIEKEKLRVAKNRQAQTPQVQNVQQQTSEEPPAVPVPDPTPEAQSWHKQNPWYGDTENEQNLEATQYAYFTHYNLINEGFEPDSDEYYDALDSRVRRVYPDLTSAEVDEEQDANQSGARPPVQRVAPTTASGRQKTRERDGVTFTKSEVARLRGLKPHNMTEEQWLISVAKEKKKIAAREAS